MKRFLLIIALLGLALAACYRKESDYLQVPKAACVESTTGQTQEEAVTTNNCFGYDKDMNCTMNVPTTTYYTRTEVRVQCNFTEWR